MDQKNFFQCMDPKKFFQCMDPKNFFQCMDPPANQRPTTVKRKPERHKLMQHWSGSRPANECSTIAENPESTRPYRLRNPPPNRKPSQAKKTKRGKQPNLQVLESAADPETIVGNIFCTGLRLRRCRRSRTCGALPGFVHRAPPKILNMHRIS